MKSFVRFGIFIIGLFMSKFALAGEVGCVSTTWRVLNDDKVCVESFKDPDVQGVACHLSYAKTGGLSGAIGLAENPSRFSIACRQVGPLITTKVLPIKEEGIFKQHMSALFKGLKVTRMVDKENNSLVYLVISEKLIDGSPFNSISTVPLMPWGTTNPQVKY